MENIASAVKELARKHFGEFRVRNGEVIPTYCPICGGGESKDRDTFAIGTWNGAWNCKRGNCQGINGKREGSFKQISDFFGESSFEFSTLTNQIVKPAKKIYNKPDPSKLKPITEECINYLTSRSISPETIKDFKLASDENGNIVFPFYRNDELVYVKYRRPKKHTKEDGPKEWQDSNTEPILFGMDNVSFKKPLVITEGEIDALSLYEAGVHNVVSVPCGCSNMEWINICYDWLDNFNEIIIFGDSDEPGIKMTTTLMSRLGEGRCMVPKEYPELIYQDHDYNRICKDANEILNSYGREGLKALVDACEPAPIKGVLQVSQIPYVDPRSQPRIMTGIHALDMMIGGFGECGVTVVSGMRGEGRLMLS